MKRLFFLANTESIEADVESLTHRSAVVLCDAQASSAHDLRVIHKWICETPDKPPKYVCFVGKHSEGSHDDYDDLCISSNRDALTTWHDDESVEDVAYFVNNVIAIVVKGLHTQIVFGTATTAYEREFVDRLKE